MFRPFFKAHLMMVLSLFLFSCINAAEELNKKNEKFALVSTSITPNQANLPRAPYIELQFNLPLNPATLNTLTVKFSPPATYQLLFQNGATKIAIIPETLNYDTKYSLILSAQIEDDKGRKLDSEVSVPFSTLAATRYALVAHRIKPAQPSADPSKDSDTIKIYELNSSNGTLTEANTYVNPLAFSNLTSIVTDQSNKFIYTSSASSNSVQALEFSAEQKTLQNIGNSPTTDSYTVQKRPFIAALNPVLPYLYVPSSTNGFLQVFHIESSGKLTAQGAEFGINTGTNYPSIVQVHPNGNFVYVSDFLGSVVSVYQVNSSNGALTKHSLSPVAAIFPSDLIPGTASQTLGMAVTPNGQFLYVTNFNTKYNHISAFRINPSNGNLSSLGAPFPVQGINPYDIVIDKNGRFAYVALYGANKINQLTIEPDGKLSFVQSFPVSPNPATLRIDPSNDFLFVGHLEAGNLEVFRINPLDGKLKLTQSVTPKAGTEWEYAQPFNIAFIK